MPTARQQDEANAPDSPAPYLLRPADADLAEAINRCDSIVLVKGARQTGRTLLIRHHLAQLHPSFRSVCTDFNLFTRSSLETVSGFYQALSSSLVQPLQLAQHPVDLWNEKRSPSLNLERYLRSVVLLEDQPPLVWALDNVDQLFPYPYASEVFGLFRSWLNDRVLDPAAVWSRLCLILTYAAEAHLFITDMNQSPFNVGTPVALNDFPRESLSDLNNQHARPLTSESELDSLYQLCGGHPFLLELVFGHLCQQPTVKTRLQDIPFWLALFNGHVQEVLNPILTDPASCHAIHQLLQNRALADFDIFSDLRARGIITGSSPGDAVFRCGLYRSFFQTSSAPS